MTKTELYHYGIKGMKWRKRKARSASVSAAEQLRRASQSESVFDRKLSALQGGGVDKLIYPNNAASAKKKCVNILDRYTKTTAANAMSQAKFKLSVASGSRYLKNLFTGKRKK